MSGTKCRPPAFCLAAAFLILLCGCGGGPDVGYVTGKVTLNGQPLANAEVEFQPVNNQRPSTGNTNNEGVYELSYTAQQKGALVGEHIVRITIGEEDEDEGVSKAVVEIPAKYNSHSELKRTVKPGTQNMDFEL